MFTSFCISSSPRILPLHLFSASHSGFWLLAATVTARPFAALKHSESTLSLATTTEDADCKSHLVVAILAFRQAHFFAKDCGEDTRVAVNQLVSSISDPWTKYKVARHAMVTGNFSVAKGLFHSILSSTSSERSFLWISTLAKVAGAEEELSSKGCRGTLSATPLLHSSVSYLMTLASGEIDPSVIQMASVSFSHVLLWHALRYIAPLEDEEESAAVHPGPSSPLMGATPPSASPLLPHGTFLPIQCQAPLEDGIYAVDVMLGVRDIRCSEWEMPAHGQSRPIMLGVSRSRA
jgi:hypothetical protein